MKGGDCGLERISTCWFESKYFFSHFVQGSLYSDTECSVYLAFIFQTFANRSCKTKIRSPTFWLCENNLQSFFTMYIYFYICIYIYIDFSSVFTLLGTAGFKMGLSKENLTIFQVDIWDLRFLQLCWKERVEKI